MPRPLTHASAGTAAVVPGPNAARAEQAATGQPAAPALFLSAAAAGALVGLSFEPFGWWPLLLVGVPGLTLLGL